MVEDLQVRLGGQLSFSQRNHELRASAVEATAEPEKNGVGRDSSTIYTGFNPSRLHEAALAQNGRGISHGPKPQRQRKILQV